MCGTEDAVDMDHRQVWSIASVVRRHNPHPVVRVRPISKYRIPVNQGTLVLLTIECERKERENTSNQEVTHAGPLRA